MNKQEFLARLGRSLSGLPQADIDDRLNFYSEMIDDRMEEGLGEEEAVAAAGSVDEIAAQTVADTPLVKLAKERIKPKRRLRAWEIVLLALGSPVWLSLLIAALAVLFSVYVVLWSLLIALWAVFGSFVCGALGGAAAGIILAFQGKALTGLAMIGAGCVCAGLAVFAFFGCRAATKGVLMLTRRIAVRTKQCFISGEEES